MSARSGSGRGRHGGRTFDPGFAYWDVTLISLESAFDCYSAEESDEKRARLVAQLQALPGVDVIASSDHKPLGDDMSPIQIRLPGEHERDARMGEVIGVSRDYFAVLELPIVRGRGSRTNG